MTRRGPVIAVVDGSDILRDERAGVHARSVRIPQSRQYASVRGAISSGRPGPRAPHASSSTSRWVIFRAPKNGVRGLTSRSACIFPQS